ncbi:hypothetical protein BV898_01433 [Hypsibius exemplaris]|uniref:Ricin B lectin domain-containing protein n=1 Tax=Hypsibius exemplaris TaxID=2072580 RepID=A0A1W0XBF6_HYPEX|nr:hypothetical protein BV898_01433 [Hypsibius exemplaris]
MAFNPHAPFIIKHVSTNTVLDIMAGSNPGKEQVILFPYNGGLNQRWTWHNGMIISQKNGLALDISLNPGDIHAVTTWAPHGQDNQRFEIKGNGRIKSQLGLCLDARHSHGHNNLSVFGAVKRKERDGGAYQKFQLVNV